MMEVRCGRCPARIRLKTRVTEAGKRVRFTCPKCGSRWETTVPEPGPGDLMADVIAGRVRWEGWTPIPKKGKP